MARDWKRIVAVVNANHELLKRKPRRLKIGFQMTPAGILNAYREGDLTFKQAVHHLEKWKKRK